MPVDSTESTVHQNTKLRVAAPRHLDLGLHTWTSKTTYGVLIITPVQQVGYIVQTAYRARTDLSTAYNYYVPHYLVASLDLCTYTLE